MATFFQSLSNRLMEMFQLVLTDVISKNANAVPVLKYNSVRLGFCVSCLSITPVPAT